MLLTSILLAATIATKADVPRVTPAELHALMDKGEAVAIDVRGSVPYELGHIKGAVWLPLGLVAQRFGSCRRTSSSSPTAPARRKRPASKRP